MKYRYILFGAFNVETSKGTAELYIEIPAPIIHSSKEMAQKDSPLTYRFVSRDGDVVIAVYHKEGYERVESQNGDAETLVWTEGDPIFFYTYEEFKKAGGVIRTSIVEGEIDIPFKNLFPDLGSDQEIYIDAESGWTDEVE